MLRVVLDTNVLISILIRSGKPRELWNAVLEERITPVTSVELLSEFVEVFSRPKFRTYAKAAYARKLAEDLKRMGIVCIVKNRLSEIAEDPADNRVLEAADVGRADYVASGDNHLLRLRHFKGIRIVTVNEMLEILRTSEDE